MCPELGSSCRAHARRACPAGRRTAHRRGCGGFTLVELVVVVVVLGALVVTALPRMAAHSPVVAHQWRSRLVAALMQARTTAEGHRRLLCATLAPGELRLAIASTQPAAGCATALVGGDGDARFVFDPAAVALGPAAATLHFQPDGRITADAAGATPVDASLAISGARTITVTGATGWID